MYKVTKRGIERVGKYNELSQEDLGFIWDLFDEFSNFEKPLEDRRDPNEDELYGDLVHS